MQTDAGDVMRRNFATLFSCLTPILSEAWREREGESISQRFDRDIERFVRDYNRRPPTRANLGGAVGATGRNYR